LLIQLPYDHDGPVSEEEMSITNIISETNAKGVYFSFKSRKSDQTYKI